jgi:hypothetical protein
MDMWTYKGIEIYPADKPNSMGIRWYARAPMSWPVNVLRADTKASMREMITAYAERYGKTYDRRVW